MSTTMPMAAGVPVRLPARPGYWGMVGRRLRRDPVTVVFCLLMLTIVLSAVFAPLLAPFDPFKEGIILRLKPFGFRGHWLGTDELGRDVLSRILYGGRTSLLMGVMPVVFASAIGGTLGVVAGYSGGWVGTLIMRVMDVFYGVSVGAVGGGDLGGDGRGDAERDDCVGAGVHSGDVPGGRDGDDAGSEP